VDRLEHPFMLQKTGLALIIVSGIMLLLGAGSCAFHPSYGSMFAGVFLLIGGIPVGLCGTVLYMLGRRNQY
jgi:hypothetical protein